MQLMNDRFEKTKKEYLNFLNKEKIYKKSISAQIKSFKKVYIPIAFWINAKYKKKGKTLLLGLEGYLVPKEYFELANLEREYIQLFTTRKEFRPFWIAYLTLLAHYLG